MSVMQGRMKQKLVVIYTNIDGLTQRTLELSDYIREKKPVQQKQN